MVNGLTKGSSSDGDTAAAGVADVVVNCAVTPAVTPAVAPAVAPAELLL